MFDDCIPKYGGEVAPNQKNLFHSHCLITKVLLNYSMLAWVLLHL